MLKTFFDTDEGVREGVLAGIRDKSFRDSISATMEYSDVRSKLSPSEKEQLKKNVDRWVLDPDVAIKLTQALIIQNAKTWSNKHPDDGRPNWGAAIASHHLGPKHLEEVYKRYNIAPSESPTMLIPKMQVEFDSLSEAQQDRKPWKQRGEFMDWWKRYLIAKERAGEYNE